MIGLADVTSDEFGSLDDRRFKSFTRSGWIAKNMKDTWMSTHAFVLRTISCVAPVHIIFMPSFTVISIYKSAVAYVWESSLKHA